MKKSKIIFLVLPEVHLLDLAGPDQVFLEASDMDRSIEVEYCSVGEEIRTSSRIGFSKFPHFSTIEVNAGDYVFIPGTDIKRLVATAISYEKELKAWLRNAYVKGAHLCSVCTGAFLLARMGFLDAKKCTTHWKRTKELKQRYPAVNMMEDVLFTEDQRIFTSAGVAAGIDMALFILERIKGEHFAFKVARELVVYMRRQGSQAQESVFTSYRNHVHSGIHMVQDYVQENINKKITLTNLADIACTSPRNLTRVFKKETGVTVNYYVTLVRKELLHRLTDQEYTRKEMASLCGLKSERQVIRLLKN